LDIEKDGLPLASASASGFMTWHITESEPHRGVEQLVARRAHNPKVVGSSPTPATKKEQSEMVALFLSPPLYEGIVWKFDLLKRDPS
jgi:hypothetical protein